MKLKLFSYKTRNLFIYNGNCNKILQEIIIWHKYK